nr:28S ribosomal protein S17, mitochondrial [Onthophagus taurus]
MAFKTASKALMVLGECVPCVKENASKFRVKRLELDQNLLMYFRKDEFIYAHDPQKQCKTGDVVLIEALPERLTRLVTHKVNKIVYRLGDVTDPLTNKKVVAGKFRDDVEAVNQIFGKKKTAFDYEKAPERGWQEDKKDYSHLETYIKYHESGKNDPAAV